MANLIIAGTGSIATGEIISANNFATSTVDASGANLTVPGNLIVQTTANLGAVGNITITGGSNGQVLITDGSGNLTWSTASTAVLATPSIISPTSGQTSFPLTGPITSTPFEIVGSSATHSSSDWQIATDSAFTTIVASSIASASNLTSWSPSGLSYVTPYYVRVRYNSSGGITSDWSDGVAFSSAAIAGTTWVNSPNLHLSGYDPASGTTFIAWSGTRFAVSGSGSVSNNPSASSPDTITWTNNSLSTLQTRRIIWGNGKFVAVGSASNSNTLRTSSDGINWSSTSALNTALGNTPNSIIWTGTQYVAVGGGGKLATSPDAVTWTSRTSSFSTTAINDIVWTGSKYVAVGLTGKVATSTDAITWTQQTGLSTTAWGTTVVNRIIWNGSKLVVIGDAGKVATSTDGITWTYQAGLIGTTWSTTSINAIVWTGSQFMVGGNNGYLATSPDGVTWTFRNNLTVSTWYDANIADLIWTGSMYVATSQGALLATSTM